MLRPPLGVDIGRILLGVGGAGQDHVGAAGAGIAVMALIDDEGRAQTLHVDFIRAQQIDQLDRPACRRRQYTFDIEPAGAGHEAKFHAADSRRRGVQHVEPVPAAFDRAAVIGNLPRRAQHRGAVFPRQSALPDHDHRLGRLAQRFQEGMVAVGQVFERVRPRAEISVFEGEIGARPDDADRELAGKPALADAGIEHRRFHARIGADEQQRVGLVDSGDRAVEQPAGARLGIELGAVLAAIEMGRAERRQQFLERQHRFAIGLIAGDRGHLGAANAAHALGDGGERLVPARRHEFAIAAHIGCVEALALQAVDDCARLVGNPLFVHGFVDARQDAHHFVAAAIDADVAAERVHRRRSTRSF